MKLFVTIPLKYYAWILIVLTFFHLSDNPDVCVLAWSRDIGGTAIPTFGLVRESAACAPPVEEVDFLLRLRLTFGRLCAVDDL